MPYAVFDQSGTAATIDRIAASAAGADVLLVGEQHDDSTGHAVERALFARLIEEAETRPVVLSLEMFDRDVQIVLDEYLAGLITETHFLQAARPWTNYADYRPLVELARGRQVPVIAANAPRRYVNLVSREGLAQLSRLSGDARAFLPPLPLDPPSPEYRRKWDEFISSMHPGLPDSLSSDSLAAPDAHGGGGAGRMLEAQTLWDASMAERIGEAVASTPGALIMHIAGAFHVEGGTGIQDPLRRYAPDARVLSVVLIPSSSPTQLPPADTLGLADFVILTCP